VGPLRPDGLKLGRPRGAPGNTGSVGEAWKLALIWCLETGHVTRPGEIWCGTIPGAFFHSADRSASWSLNRALRHDPARQEWFGGGYDYPGVHSVSLHPDEPDTMLVGVSGSGARLPRDGGASWTIGKGMHADDTPPAQADKPGHTRSTPYFVHCRTVPNVLCSQHHNSAYRSTDGGAVWEEIHPAVSSFGFTVAAHPREADTAWYVPAVSDEVRVPVSGKFVVTRTRDGGRTRDTARQRPTGRTSLRPCVPACA